MKQPPKKKHKLELESPGKLRAQAVKQSFLNTIGERKRKPKPEDVIREYKVNKAFQLGKHAKTKTFFKP